MNEREDLPARALVKLGGNAVAGPGLAAIAHDIAALAKRGTELVVVHGGGPQTSALQERLGQTPRQIAGRRVTDEAALDVLKMVVGGKLNIDTCAALVRAGARPIGLSGASSLVLVSDIAGVLRDVSDPASRIARLTEAEAHAAIDTGAVTKGMIPKLEEAFSAIRAGVGRVHIVGSLREGELARELASPGSLGTALVP